MNWKKKALIGSAIVAGVGASIFGGYQIGGNQTPVVRPAYELIQSNAGGTNTNFQLNSEGMAVKDGDYHQVDLSDNGYQRNVTTLTENSTVVVDGDLVDKLRLNGVKATTKNSVVFIGDSKLLESAGTVYAPKAGKVAIDPNNE